MGRKIEKSSLQEQSVLHHEKSNCHYIDSFPIAVNYPKARIAAVDVARAFFSSSPKWIEKLFVFRDKAVAVFGLKTSGKSENREQQLRNFKFEVGEQLGLFKVFHRSDSEVVLGEDDKHLNFRVSLLLCDSKVLDQRILNVTTTVHFNNRFGKVYFIPVQPFHQLIVPTMMRSIVKQIEKMHSV